MISDLGQMVIRCERGLGPLSAGACARRWSIANGKLEGRIETTHAAKCRACPHGETRAAAGLHVDTLAALAADAASGELDGREVVCNLCMQTFMAKRLGVLRCDRCRGKGGKKRAPAPPRIPQGSPVAPICPCGQMVTINYGKQGRRPTKCEACRRIRTKKRRAPHRPILEAPVSVVDVEREYAEALERTKELRAAERALESPAPATTTTEVEETPMPTKRDCATCGKAFTPSGPRSKYCLSPCTKESARSGVRCVARVKRGVRPRTPEVTSADVLGADLLALMRRHGLSSSAVNVASLAEGHVIEVQDDLPIILRIRNVSQLRLEQLED